MHWMLKGFALPLLQAPPACRLEGLSSSPFHFSPTVAPLRRPSTVLSIVAFIHHRMLQSPAAGLQSPHGEMLLPRQPAAELLHLPTLAGQSLALLWALAPWEAAF